MKTTISLLLIFALISPGLSADQVSATDNGLKLLADHRHHSKARVFLIVHGTWAHKDMEIIQTMQDVLDEYAESSLAMTLSLGIDSREGFYPCDVPVTHRYEDAVNEIEFWVAWLADQGYKQIVLVGHSRGAAQALLFDRKTNDGRVSQLALLGPMMFQASDVSVNRTPEESRRLFHCDNIQISEASYASYLGPQPEKNSARLLTQTSTPAIVFLGSDDALTEHFIAEHNDQESVTVNVIDGADHFFRDFYMDEIVEALLDWLP